MFNPAVVAAMCLGGPTLGSPGWAVDAAGGHVAVGPSPAPCREAQPAAPAADAAPDPFAAIGRITLTDAQGKDRAEATVFWISATEAVTNWHVVQHGPRAVITMLDGSRHRVVSLVGADERADVAVVRAQPPFAGAPLELEPALPVRGDCVWIVTTMLMSPEPQHEATVLIAGEVAFYGPSLVLGAPHSTEPGWSGSPMLDVRGRVIGVARGGAPAKAYGAPAAAVAALRSGPGVPFADWDRTPATRFGISQECHLRASRVRGDRLESALLLLESVRESPDFWVGWAALADTAYFAGDLDAAIAWLGRAAELSPMAHHSMTLADFCSQARRPEDAAHAAARALALDPEGALFHAHKKLAMMLALRGKAREAVPLLSAAVDGAPREVIPRVTLAQCLAITGRADDALRHADKALDADPGYAPAYYARGLALTRLGRWAEAVEPLEISAAIDPPRALSAQRLLVHSYVRTGNSLAALLTIAEVETRDPTAAMILKSELRLLRSRLADPEVR